jgi:hypothetical protein
MTILATETLLSLLPERIRRGLALLLALAVVTSAGAPALAEPASPEVSAVKRGPKPAPRPRAKPAANKQTAAKSKARVRPSSATPAPAAASPAQPAPAPAPPPASPAQPAPAAKPTQVMDFDNDEVEGQRLEPGFELIQGPPRRARHGSLVPYPPKPEDSVVQGN